SARGRVTAFEITLAVAGSFAAIGAEDPAPDGVDAVRPISLADAGHRAIPYFARKYGVACSTCHVTPPKLNEVGEEFLARGYRFPDGRPENRTLPAALWVSTRGDWQAGPEESVPYVNRVELISGGPIFGDSRSYFLEWRAVSLEAQPDGSLRDRSGRFEDLFVQQELSSDLLLVLGQFRMLTQVDVSRRLSLSEPAALSTSLAGDPATTPRLTSLRGFSQAGRSPAVRLQLHRRVAGRSAADGWYVLANVPWPGELSIPLTGEARENASFELEGRPKGVFLESYYRRSLATAGVHAFVGDDRWLAGGIGTLRHGPWFSAVELTLAHRGESFGRWTWDNEWIPSPWIALGLRVEDRAGDGLDPAAAPYANAHWPGTRYTLRLTVEHRVQNGRRASTAVELGMVF
ncbi:MAG: hypothetical protein ACREKI_02080, partial [Gemmatimonadota bacterium]